MAGNMARIGRRRRILNEEVLTAGNPSQRESAPIPGDTPRYGAGANIENHPQVTDLVPRKYRAIALVVTLAIGVGVLAELAAHQASRWSEKIPVISADEITTTLADRTVAWTSAALLLLIVGYTRLIYSLRRHRVDDYRGRYRVWRTAGWAAGFVSFATITGAHTMAATVLGHLTGWSWLPNSSGWWLVPATLLGGWLMVKLSYDAAECRTALFAYVLAIGCFALAAAASVGFSPAWLADWTTTPGRLLPLCGNTFLFAGCLLFARYVVLDVQGLIEHRETSELPQVAKSTTESYQSDTPVLDKKMSAEATSVASKGEWIDGTDSDVEVQKLSKAERKRLRKQNTRNRAA
jgi:hypothetical protein